MRNSWFFVGLALVASTLVSCAGPTPLKVLTWNIEYGGAYTDFAEVVATIRAADADVVALSEGYSSVEPLARALGYPYFDHGMQVLSRFPLLEPAQAGGAYLFVETSPGRGVALSNVHLDSDPYGPYQLRDGLSVEAVLKSEADTHLIQLESQWKAWPGLLNRKIPVFVTGDFNVPSPLDGPVAWPVGVRLGQLGFRDSYRDIHPDPVARPGLTWFARRPAYATEWNPDPNDLKDRIDFVYAGGPVKTLASVVYGEEGEPVVDLAKPGVWVSDHRAVLSTFAAEAADLGDLVAVDRRFVEAGDPVTVTTLTSGTAGRWQLRGPGPSGDIVRDEPLGAGRSVQVVATAGLVPGAYQAVVVGSGAAPGPSSPWFEVQPTGAGPEVEVDRTSYFADDKISVTYAQTPGCRWDWVAVYPVGTDLTSGWGDYLASAYAAHGSATGALVPPARGVVTLSAADLAPGGPYEVVFLTLEHEVVARSGPFTLEAAR